MNGVSRLLGRIAGFGALPLLSSLAPMILLPIISRVGPSSDWTGVVVAQTVGSFAGVVVMSGWAVTGQSRVAMEVEDGRRRALYRSSLRGRLALFVVVAPLAAWLAVAVSRPTHWFGVALMSLAMTQSGLSLSWYATGVGKPSWIARYEVVPRITATLGAIPLVLITKSVWPYPLVLAIASAIGLCLFALAHARAGLPTGVRNLLRAPFDYLREDWRAAVVGIAGTGYGSAPLPVAAGVGGGASAGIASADRLYRYGLLAVIAVGNALQSWVFESESRVRSRQRLAMAIHLGVGAAGLAILVFLGNRLTGWIFGAAVAAPEPACVWYGFGFLCVSVSTSMTRHVLIPAGRVPLVMGATVGTAVIGIPTMVTLALSFGATGAVAGFVLSEVVLLCTLAPATGALLLPSDRREG